METCYYCDTPKFQDKCSKCGGELNKSISLQADDLATTVFDSGMRVIGVICMLTTLYVFYQIIKTELAPTEPQKEITLWPEIHDLHQVIYLQQQNELALLETQLKMIQIKNELAKKAKKHHIIF